MREKIKTLDLSVGDFLKVHTLPGCQVEAVPLGIIAGGGEGKISSY
ncbi:hypothetical protein KKE48_02385 [Patescibacteria group bacterium]|nr:hypothetical protein [Patescibacteria group bacterium]